MGPLADKPIGGRYRLDAEIGAGGMSRVYRAVDLTLERPVAVKVLRPLDTSYSRHLERFRREARNVARLSHPHIVRVLDAGDEDGRPYIVFEYIAGQTLKERIDRMGRLPVDEAVAYAIEIARALACAHAHGIVHRDVKPQNVLLDERGAAKVTDFGIARALDDDSLTGDGRVLGTAAYLSPEQALGHEVDAQSDIYSLGIVLYEMLTGEVPFRSDSQVAVAMMHVREDLPDIQGERPGVSAMLGAVLDRMTEKDLGRRYPSADALITDLEDALALETARAGESTGEATAVLRTIPAPARRTLPLRLRFRIPAIAVAGLLAAGAIFSGVVLRMGADRVQRGTGAPPGIEAPPGLTNVSLSRTAAHDYDPQGDLEEHRELAGLAIDRDDATAWSTESYEGGTITKSGAGGERAGVGIYVDAKPEVRATWLELRTPTPGWTASIYAAPAGAVPSRLDRRWTRVGGGVVGSKKRRLDLDTKRPYRYYLVWITQLSPNRHSVQISEIALLGPAE
jgi:hypothetical protein